MNDFVADILHAVLEALMMSRGDDFDRLLKGPADALAEPGAASSLSLRVALGSGGQVPEIINVVAVPRKSGLSQAALRNREQGYRSPTGSTLVGFSFLPR